MKLSIPSPPATDMPAMRIFSDWITRAVGIVVANLRNVPHSTWTTVAASSSADTPFIVYHDLGRAPAFFMWQSEASANCYATAADRSEWNTKYIKVRCTVANAALRIKVEAD